MSERPETDRCPVCGCKEDYGRTFLATESDIDNDFPAEFKRCSKCSSPFLELGQHGHSQPYVEKRGEKEMSDLQQVSINVLKDEKSRLEDDLVEIDQEVEDMELELEAAESRKDVIEHCLSEIEEEIERREVEPNEIHERK